MDFFDSSDVEESIRRLDALFACGIFSAENSRHPLFRAAFVDVLIALRDLMYKAEKYSERITFSDDVNQTDKVKDVTGVIKYVRDALCHPDSDNHYIEVGNIKASFNVIFGRGCAISIGEFSQESPYEDDICFFFGMQRIFLRRHIYRAYTEAKSKLIPLMGNC